MIHPHFSRPAPPHTGPVSFFAALLVAAVLAGAAFAQSSRPAGDLDYRTLLLDLCERRDPKADLGPARAQFDVFEIELRRRIGKKRGEAAIAALVDYFFKDRSFTAGTDLADPNLFYADKVIEGKEGYCLSLSALILAVARRLDLPLSGVAAPRHFFLRWDDGRTRKNIETTEGGRIRDDDWYRATGIDPAAEKDGVYLRSLSPTETAAYLLNNEGFILYARGEKAAARERFESALRYHPKLAEAWINLGIIEAEAGNAEKAKEAFDRVLAWMPSDAATVFNKAFLSLRSGEWKAGLRDLEQACFADSAKSRFGIYRQALTATLFTPDHWRSFQRAAVSETAGGPRRAEGLKAVYFADREFRSEAASRIDRAIDFEWRNAAPVRGTDGRSFGVRWSGYLQIDEESAYTILVAADGGARVFLDGVCWVVVRPEDEDGLGRETVRLFPGLHRLRVEYVTGPGPASIALRVKRADRAEALPASVFVHD